MGYQQRKHQRLLDELMVPRITVRDHKQKWLGHTLRGFIYESSEVGYSRFWFDRDGWWESLPWPLPQGVVLNPDFSGISVKTLGYAVDVAVIGDVLAALNRRIEQANASMPRLEEQRDSCLVFLERSIRQTLGGPYTRAVFERADRELARHREQLIAFEAARNPPPEPASQPNREQPQPEVRALRGLTTLMLFEVLADEPRAPGLVAYAIHPPGAAIPYGAAMQLTDVLDVRLGWGADGRDTWQVMLCSDSDSRGPLWAGELDGSLTLAAAAANTFAVALAHLLATWHEEATQGAQLTLRDLYPQRTVADAGAALRQAIHAVRLATLRCGDTRDRRVSAVAGDGQVGVLTPQVMNLVNAAFEVT